MLPQQKCGQGIRRDTPLAEGRDVNQPKCSIGLRETRGVKQKIHNRIFMFSKAKGK